MMMVSLLLQNLGMTVDAANCGPAAIECLRSCGYDFVVTDLEMPGMDGYKLAARIKLQTPLTKVIIMTGRSPFELEEKMNAGVVDRWLFKPFGGYELRTTLSKLVDTTSSVA
jgi:CheY-like chemotaxis protein